MGRGELLRAPGRVRRTGLRAWQAYSVSSRGTTAKNYLLSIHLLAQTWKTIVMFKSESGYKRNTAGIAKSWPCAGARASAGTRGRGEKGEACGRGGRGETRPRARTSACIKGAAGEEAAAESRAMVEPREEETRWWGQRGHVQPPCGCRHGKCRSRGGARRVEGNGMGRWQHGG